MRIRGRVELPAGASRAAARVELVSALEDYDAAKRELAGAPPPPPLASAHPDREGAFLLVAPGPGCYLVQVRAEGYRSVERLLAPLVEDAELPTARLEPAAQASVRAVGADGRPVAGLRLAAAAAPSTWWEGQEPPPWRAIERAGRTGADGRLAFERATGESLVVEVVDLRNFGASVAVEAVAGAGRPAEPTLHLARRPAVVLEARDPAGHPVAGALLRLAGGRAAAIAGSDGRLEVSFEDPRSAGAQSAATLASPGGELWGEVDWRRARGGLLRVGLAPVREVSGRLAERTTGAAVGGGLVWIERTDWRGATGVAVVAAIATAGADGRFRLRLRTADDLRPRAAARGYLAARPDEPAQAGGTGSWRIALDRAASLEGVVVDAGGRGIAGAAIGFRPRFPVPAAPPRARSGADGRFRLPDVVAGERYELAVSAPGFAPASASVRVPRPEPGKPAAPVRIVLEPGRSLAGTVVDEAGRPLAGVAVTLLPSEGLPIALWKNRSADGSAREARTDAAGAFEIVHLAAGRYGLAAHGPGLATTLRDGIDLGPASAPLDLGRIVVERGAAIAGRVVDRRGAAVAGALVESAPSPKGLPSPIESAGAVDGTLSLGGRLDSDVVRAGPDGRFEIAGLRRGEAFDLTVHAEEHPTASRRDVRAPTEEPLSIVLDDGGRVSGRVVDGRGRPVFGAQVSGEEAGLRRLDGGLDGWGDRGGAAAATDAQGEFSLAGLPAGAVDLSVEAPGYRAARRRGVPVAAGRETAGVEIVLDAGSSLSGHLRDAAGKPLARAGVMAQRDVSSFDIAALMTGEQTMSLAQGRTDADGAYRLEGLETGRYQVSAVYGRQGARATVNVQPGENTLDLAAEAYTSAEVSGRVMDTAGAPVAGATVRLRQDGSEVGLPLSTLADGFFAFQLTPGEYLLSAEARGYARADYPEPVVVAEAAVSGLEIALARVSGAIRGKLAGLDPAELLRVHLTAVPFGPGSPLDSRAAAAAVVGTVDGAGAYRIDDLAPGSWSVVALADSGRRASGVVTLAPGGPEGILDLDLAGGATLSGRVTRDGRPVAGAQVVVGVLDRSKVPAQSDTASDGSFRISGLEPAAYTLVVIDPRTFSVSLSTVAVDGDREVAVDLSAGALRGRVLAATGEPVAGAEVILAGIDPPRPAGLGTVPPPAQTGADGTFEIPSLITGRYRVTASREGFGLGQATVEVVPHATAQVEIRLGAAP